MSMLWDLMERRKDFVQQVVGLHPMMIKGKKPDGTVYKHRWHRSKGKRHKFPFASYMLNKKWTLEEEFNNHMLRFQQVNRRIIYSNQVTV